VERGAAEEADALLGGCAGLGEQLPPSAAADAYGIAARIAILRADRQALIGRDADSPSASLAASALAAARCTDSPVVLAMAELDSAHVQRGLGRPATAAAAAARAAALFGRKQHLVGEGWARAFRSEAGDQ